MHGNIEFVAAGIFEDQHFQWCFVDRFCHQPEIASDTVILVHDRRPGAQVGQLADDLFGFARRPSPAAALPHPFAEKLVFGYQSQRRLFELQALLDRRHRDRQFLAGSDERLPVLAGRQADTVAGEYLDQGFSPARRFGCEQDATGERFEVALQCGGRLPGPGVEVQRGWFFARIMANARVCAGPFEWLPDDSWHRLHEFLEFLRRAADFIGSEDGTRGIVTPLFVSFDDFAPRGAERRIEIRGQNGQGAGRQVIQQGAHSFVKQWQIVFGAARRVALGNFLIDMAGAGVAFEPLPKPSPKKPDAVFVQRIFVRRQQPYPVHACRGSLRLRIKAAQGIDLVI
ncbi:hypothetical protein MnTg04_00263 [bacterium MnTg04]|nr:hypothetical protein MnTg04_00263 [bacterium MnTg04]